MSLQKATYILILKYIVFHSYGFHWPIKKSGVWMHGTMPAKPPVRNQAQAWLCDRIAKLHTEYV